MGIKDQKLTEAYRLMHGRGVTCEVLAERLCTARSHVSLVLSGRRRKGRTWDRVKRELTVEEVALLEGLGVERSTGSIVAGGTFSR